MLAFVFRNWPNCLLALLAICIVGGQFEQLGCKLSGCKAAAMAPADCAGDGDQSGPSGEHDHCACPCHFLTLAPGAFLVQFLPTSQARIGRDFLRQDHAPESPCAEIDYPPQLLRA